MPNPARRRAGTAVAMEVGRLARPRPPPDLRVAGARGSIVVDHRGRPYIDFTAGWCVGNLGWAEPEIQERLRRFAGPDYVLPGLEYAPWDELAQRLCAVAPAGMARAFRATTGTEAVELALQAAVLHTRRRRFLAVEGAYHGNSLSARSVGSRHEDLPEPFATTRRLRAPLGEDALRDAERHLRREDVAAVVMEPVSCALASAPEPEFVAGLEELCHDHGTLLVFDEVACGFGRTGRLFAAQHFNAEPDILCLAKGLTSGYAPMGATLMTAEVGDAVVEPLDFYATYGWHPLAVEAALATLDIFERDEDRILRNVAQRGRQVCERVEAMDVDAFGGVQGLGLALGVPLHGVEDGDVVAACRRNGLLVQASDGMLHLFPSLTISRQLTGKAMDLLEDSARTLQ